MVNGRYQRNKISQTALWQVLKQSEHFDVWHSPAPWTRNPGPEGLALGKRWPDDVCLKVLPGLGSNALRQQSVHLDRGPGLALLTRDPGPGPMDLRHDFDLVT